ncbi:hypothetical protein C3L33_14465, partial [Rhododendron williamsianum]
MSTLTEDGVISVKNAACERLLNQRVELKMKSKKINDCLNRFHVAMPKPRDQKERPPCIPQAVLEAKAKKKWRRRRGSWRGIWRMRMEAQCLKFKMDQAQDAKKMEKLNNIFFTLMSRGPEGRLVEREDHNSSLFARDGDMILLVLDAWQTKIFEPLLQYDASEDAYFKLYWNQSSFEGEAGDLLNWPKMFVQRNKLEVKCLKKVKEAERDGFDPRESIRGIKRDPKYASDPEVSDYSDDE